MVTSLSVKFLISRSKPSNDQYKNGRMWLAKGSKTFNSSWCSFFIRSLSFWIAEDDWRFFGSLELSCLNNRLTSSSNFSRLLASMSPDMSCVSMGGSDLPLSSKSRSERYSFCLATSQSRNSVDSRSSAIRFLFLTTARWNKGSVHIERILKSDTMQLVLGLFRGSHHCLGCAFALKTMGSKRFVMGLK